MNNKLLAGLAILAIVLGGVAVLRPSRVVVEKPQGALSSPDIQSTWIKIGGLRLSARHAVFTGTATSTPCVFQVTATSTLIYTSLKITTASSTATTWTVAKANGSNATTTVLTTFPALASGAQGTMVATTTPGTLVAGSTPKPDVDGITIFSPNQNLVWGVAGLTYTGYDSTLLGGSCDALFIATE